MTANDSRKVHLTNLPHPLTAVTEHGLQAQAMLKISHACGQLHHNTNKSAKLPMQVNVVVLQATNGADGARLCTGQDLWNLFGCLHLLAPHGSQRARTLAVNVRWEFRLQGPVGAQRTRFTEEKFCLTSRVSLNLAYAKQHAHINSKILPKSSDK